MKGKGCACSRSVRGRSAPDVRNGGKKSPRLHPLGHLDTEETEAAVERPGGEGAEGEAAGAEVGLGFEDGAGFEEAVEEAG